MRTSPRCAAVTRLGLGLAAPAIGAAALAAALLSATPARASGPGQAGATTASVRPTQATPGGLVTVTVSCASLDTAAANLLGQPLRLPALIPMNAAATDGDFVVIVRLPSGIRPGSYRPRVACSDGTSATVALRVESVRLAAARAVAASQHAASTGPASPLSAGLAIGGVALMAVGAVAGGSALALRRRSRANP